MALYRVRAKVTSYYYTDIEATSPDEAYYIAAEASDEEDFSPDSYTPCTWEILRSVERLHR